MTDATVKTISEACIDVAFSSPPICLAVESLPENAGKSIPDADNVVLPELHT